MFALGNGLRTPSSPYIRVGQKKSTYTNLMKITALACAKHIFNKIPKKIALLRVATLN